jgi:penicillin-binding protein 2
MAVFAATLANGGTVYSPRLVLSRGDPGNWSRQAAPGVAVNRMHWSARTLETVRGGMYDVIHAESGTGKRARLPGVLMAGKTGTAEYGPRSDRGKYGWMLLFAPFESPLYAVAMVVEDAVSGGITVAPRLRAMMAGVLGVSETGEAEPVAEAVAEPMAEEVTD